MVRRKANPSPKVLLPIFVVSLLMFIPLNNDKVFAVTDTPTPTITTTPTPTSAPISLSCVNGNIVCEQVSTTHIRLSSPIQVERPTVHFSYNGPFPLDVQVVVDFDAGFFTYSAAWGAYPSLFASGSYVYPGQYPYIGGGAARYYYVPAGEYRYDWPESDYLYYSGGWAGGSSGFGVGYMSANGAMIDIYAGTETATPTATPTATFTSTATATFTPTYTPTSTATFTPTITTTPNRTGVGTCWNSGASWPDYYANYTIDSTIPNGWISSIDNAANTWTNVTPSHFVFYNSPGTNNTISYGPVNPQNRLALTLIYASTTTPIIRVTTVISDTKVWDASSTPAPGSNSVENVMTHEFGHWLQLEDIIDDNCSHVTMYHEVISQTGNMSLDIADENGINYQYP